MRRVIIESPYAGNISDNLSYLKRCLRDSIDRGEAPIASHLIYPFVLREDLKDERQLGIELGYAWWRAADCIIFYTDKGYSPGMDRALARAHKLGIPWRERVLAPKPGQILRWNDGNRPHGLIQRIRSWWRGDVLEYWETEPARSEPEPAGEKSQPLDEFINQTLARGAPSPVPWGEPIQS